MGNPGYIPRRLHSARSVEVALSAREPKGSAGLGPEAGADQVRVGGLGAIASPFDLDPETTPDELADGQ
jgi:hypothetical protein